MPQPKIIRLDGPFQPGRHTLIFVHVPKCGGTSLHRTLETIPGLRYRHLRGRPEDLDGIEALDGVGGHQNFSATPLHKARDGLVYITVLRSPRTRILSFYRHVMAHTHHHLHRQFPGLAAMGPVAFVETLARAGNFEIENLQTKMLTGRGDISASDAIAHVEASFSVVGLLEEPDSYLAPLGRMFPGAITQNRLNVGEGPVPQAADEPALATLIDETNGKDRALYAHVAAAREAAAREAGAGRA